MRIISGSDAKLDIEKKIIEYWLRSIDEEGLYHRPNRPWSKENVWEEAKREWSNDEPPYSGAHPLRSVTTRVFEAMILYHTRDHNPMWKQLVDRAIEHTAHERFVDKGDWGYFGSRREVPTGKRGRPRENR